MFRNREIRVKIAKSDKDKDITPGEDKFLHPDTVKLIIERGKEAVKILALTAVGVYAAIKTIDTLSEIAVKKTKSADNEK